MIRPGGGGEHDAGGIAFRHDPDSFSRSLPRRPRTALPYDPAALPAGMAVMLDTSVYIERLRGRLPEAIIACIDARPVLHSAVACAELAISAGLLDPAHPSTAGNRGAIARLLGTIASVDIVAPEMAAWIEAGMIAGILARTQHGAGDGVRRRLLNDALMFLDARARGAALVSMDRTDMDLLLRFCPDATVLLFPPDAG